MDELHVNPYKTKKYADDMLQTYQSQDYFPKWRAYVNTGSDMGHLDIDNSITIQNPGALFDSREEAEEALAIYLLRMQT